MRPRPTVAPGQVPVLPRPAATVVLVRPGPDGPEVLLTLRPAAMAFAGDVYVFPGGAIDAADGAVDAARLREHGTAPFDAPARVAAVRELFEEAGILLADQLPEPASLARARQALLRGETSLPDLVREAALTLRTDLLVPLSRWVTPAPYPRRFDARFFAAALPAGVEPSFEPAEVAGHRWLRPAAALDALAAGQLRMWLPTSVTLQQLEHVSSFGEIRGRLTPGERLPVATEEFAETIVRFRFGAAGAVPGQVANGYLVGRRELVLVDPGDPGEDAAEAILAAAAGRGRIAAIVLTHVDPDHAAGSEGLAERLEVPVYTGRGGGRRLPFEVREIADREVVQAGDVALTAIATPGPRPDHVSLVARDEGIVIAGDLVGRRGSRALPGPPDVPAWLASLDRLANAVGASVLLPGHGDPIVEPGPALAAARAEQARAAATRGEGRPAGSAGG